MSATQDLLPFPKHDSKPSPVVRTKVPGMVTVPLAKPAKAVHASARGNTCHPPSIAPISKSPRKLEQSMVPPQGRMMVPQGGPRVGAKFAQARFARSVELAGSCLLIVTFLAAALFV